MTTDKYLQTLRQIQALINEALSEAPLGKKPKAPKEPAKPAPGATSLSFDMNILAFTNKYARRLSGPSKFTLVVAYLVKGNLSGQVSYQDIMGQWNKMKTVLGDPNGAHANRAKGKGWVEPAEYGMWKLTSGWKEALD
jgi:hypothetical protein